MRPRKPTAAATPAPVDTRHAILSAALDAYSRFGFRGATTRRIAELAGVNEVTVFRHFGSKEALLREALRALPPEHRRSRLPDMPRHPEDELTAWAEHQLTHFREKRAMIRTCMGEMEERPELSGCAAAVSRAAFDELCQYLRRVREEGLAQAVFDENIAAITLLGALFADATGREMMPEIYPAPFELAAHEYAALIVRAIGADDASRAAFSDATGAPRG